MENNPDFFPISFGLKAAEEKVIEYLNLKNLEKYFFLASELEYIPYYFFSFDVYKEDKNSTKALVKGKASLNAYTGELETKLSNIVLLMSDRENKINNENQYKIIPARIKQEEFEKLAKMEIASINNTKSDMVILSGSFFAFVPFWKIKVGIAGKQVDFFVNGVDCSLECKSELPEKKIEENKDKEELEDLWKIEKWPKITVESFSYLADFVKETIEYTKSLGRKNQNKKIKIDKKDVLVIALALIAIILIVYVFLL